MDCQQSNILTESEDNYYQQAQQHKYIKRCLVTDSVAQVDLSGSQAKAHQQEATRVPSKTKAATQHRLLQLQLSC